MQKVNYTPLSVASGVSVGNPQQVQPDPMVDKLTSLAIQQGGENIRSRRAEMYVRGEMQAAEGIGIQELRRDTPMYEKIFGGGARMSGAVDMAVNTQLIRYKQAVETDMPKSRKLSPEAFRTQQMDVIKQFQTGDDTTDALIMQQYAAVAPELARIHSKQHALYTQEINLQNYTNQLTAAGDSYITAPPEEMANASLAMQAALSKPEEMDEDTHQELLFSVAESFAKQGNPKVMEYLLAKDVVNTPNRIKKLDAAHTAYTKQQAEQEMQVFNKTWAGIRNSIKDGSSTVDELPVILGDLKNQYKDTFDVHVSPGMIRDIYSLHAAQQKKLTAEEQVNTNLELFLGGSAFNLTSDQLKPVYSVLNATLKTVVSDPVKYKEIAEQMAAGYNSTGVKNTALINRFSAGLFNGVQEDPEGNLVLTAGADETIKELDLWYDVGNGSKILTDMMSPDVAAAYMMFRTLREDSMGGIPDAKLLQQAGEYREKKRTIDEYTLRGLVKTVGETVLEDLDMDDAAALSADIQSDIQYVSSQYATLYGNSVQARAAVSAHIKNNWEVQDGIPFRKVNGTALDSRTGVPNTIKNFKMFYRLQHPTVNWGDTVITLHGDRDEFALFDKNDPTNTVIVPFEEFQKFHEKSIPAKQTAEYDLTLEHARDLVRRKYGREQVVDFLQDPTPDTVPETFDVASLSDAEVFAIAAQEQADGRDRGVIKTIMNMLKNVLPQSDNDWDTWGEDTPSKLDDWISRFFSGGEEPKNIHKEQAKAVVSGMTEAAEAEAEKEGVVMAQAQEVAAIKGGDIVRKSKKDTISSLSNKITQITLSNEGDRYAVYKDSHGNNTVARGWVLSNKNSPQGIKDLFKEHGITDLDNIKKGDTFEWLTPEVLEKTTKKLTEKLTTAAFNLVPHAPDRVILSLVDIKYQANMWDTDPRRNKSPHFTYLISNRQYWDAGIELLRNDSNDAPNEYATGKGKYGGLTKRALRNALAIMSADPSAEERFVNLESYAPDWFIKLKERTGV